MVPPRTGKAPAHRFLPKSGCAGHTGPSAEGMTGAERHRRGWGCLGPGGPYFPHPRLILSGRCGARPWRTQTALFLTNYPSPVPGKIYDPNCGRRQGARPPRARRRSAGRRSPSAGATAHPPPPLLDGTGREQSRLLLGLPRTPVSALPRGLQAGKGLRTPPFAAYEGRCWGWVPRRQERRNGAAWRAVGLFSSVRKTGRVGTASRGGGKCSYQN